MNILESVSICLSKYATFSGRASRNEYWKFLLAYALAIIALGILFDVTNWSIVGYIGGIVIFGSVIPILSVGVRRLHDTGRPGTWMFLRFVPFAGDLVLFIFSCEDSQPFTNQYGPPPRPGPYAVSPPGPPASMPPKDSDLPFYQARQKAAFEAVARQRFESSEPSLDSKKVDDYFDHATGDRAALVPTSNQGSSYFGIRRKHLGLIGAGAVVALAILGIILGVGSWRSTPPTTVNAAAPVIQPVATPTSQPTPLQPTSLQPAAPVAIQPTSAAPIIQPGDLGITSPLRPVTCTGKFLVLYHSSVVPATYAQDVQANLASHPGSKYLLTLSSCSSLTHMSVSGTMIYVVYGGPFDTLEQACVAASRFPEEAYVKVLDNTTPSDQSVRPCS